MSTRRTFLDQAAAFAVLGLTDVRLTPFAAARARADVPDSYPRHDAAVVEEFVRVAHTDLREVRTLVEAQPSLAGASWDWGFGDWETGLGAASHSGKRDIAEFLFAHGARPTIFSATMMGHLDVVRAFISAQPAVAGILGPHGLTLLHHARVGGADSKAVLSYLETIPEANRPLRSQPLDASLRATFTGRYRFASGERDYFDVDVRNDQLGLQRPGTNRRFLLHTGNAQFFPSGVPSVRITFGPEGGRPSRLTVSDASVYLIATRTD